MIGAITAGLLGVGVPASTNSYESISTVTVGAGGQASITFSSIPATYKHLQIRYMARDARAVNFDNLSVQFNSDAGGNYAYHSLIGDGSTASAGAAVSQGQTGQYWIGGSTLTSGVFAVGIVDILDYADTNKFKTTRAISGLDNNTSGGIGMWSGLWRSTSAINSVVLQGSTGSTISQYSSFALYGIKG